MMSLRDGRSQRLFVVRWIRMLGVFFGAFAATYLGLSVGHEVVRPLAFVTDNLTVTANLTMTGATLTGFPTTTCAAGQAEITTTGTGTSTCAAFGSSSLTNSAGANVVPKSDGTNFIASSIDDGASFATQVTTTREMNFLASTPTVKFGPLLGGLPGGYIYIDGAEMDSGYETNSNTLMYFNYSGYHEGTTQFRDLCIADGKQHVAPCIAFFKGSNARVGIGQQTPASALDVTGQIRSTLGMLSSGLTGTFDIGTGGTWRFLADAVAQTAYFQTPVSNGVGFGNQISPLSPVDVVGGGFGRTDENPSAMKIVGSGTYNTTAANRRAYASFWDNSPTISAGANILTGIGLRIAENQGGHPTVGGTIHPVGLWIDEGETWIGEHIMFVVRPGHLAAPSIGACGSAPSGSTTGNDDRGRITVGGGVVGSCTLTFALAWVNSLNVAITPTCLVQDETGSIALSYTPTSTTLTITGTGLSGSFINYDCAGEDNAIIGP